MADETDCPYAVDSLLAEVWLRAFRETRALVRTHEAT